MKSFRALLLLLALSVCSYAGDMPNGITGEMPNEKATAIDPVKEIALLVLQDLLPLF